MFKFSLKFLMIGALAAALGACATTTTPGPAAGPDYGAVFETKRGVILTARATEQAVFENGDVRQVAATQFLIREAGSGDLIEITETGASALGEGDPVLVVYGPETRVVYDQ